MRKLEDIEQDISQLSREEYTELRDWFLARDADAWDRQIEDDVRSGKLDQPGAAARRAFAEGKTTKL
jgi:hypothetical protein